MKVNPFDRNTLGYMAGLLFLFAGIAIEFSYGIAMIVLGAVLTAISVATSFFLTWLSTKVKSK